MLTEEGHPALRVRVASQQQIGGPNDSRQLHRVGDHTRCALADGQRQERLVEGVAIRQAKGDIAGPQVDIDTELLAQQLDCLESDRGPRYYPPRRLTPADQ